MNEEGAEITGKLEVASGMAAQNVEGKVPVEAEVGEDGENAEKEMKKNEDKQKNEFQPKNLVKNESNSPVEVPPEIFKLNIHCLHEIFEWLSLYELHQFGRTCKRFQQAAGDFFRSNYVSKRVTAEKGGICIAYRELDTFSEYITRIEILGQSLKLHRYIGANCISLRKIRFEGSLLEDRIECLKDVLKNIKVVDIVECPNREEFYEFFLKHCPNIKSLSIVRSYKVPNQSVIIGNGNDWMFRKYPTLEYFELTQLYELQQDEIKKFLELNPNIRTFTTDSNSLWTNRHSILESNIKLDKLAIEFTSKELANNILDLLTELHERQFYKRLHVYSTFISENPLQRMFSLPFSRSMEMMHGRFERIDVPLINLKMLGICYGTEVLNMADLPKQLPNLESIYFTEAKTDHILPFIQHSPKLKSIQIKRFCAGTHYVRGFIDLTTLNDERAKLENARKVTIYVNEYFVLSSKWANKPIKYKFIEMRRFEASEWDELNSTNRNYRLSDYNYY